MKKLLFPMLVFGITATLAVQAGAVTDIFTIVSDTDCIVEEVYHHDSSGYIGKSYPGTNAVNVIEPKPYPYTYPPDYDDDDATAGSTWDNETGKYFVGTGADWIWDTEYASIPLPGEPGYNPDTDRASWGHAILLSKTFNIPGTPVSAKMHITADNCYTFWINAGTGMVSDGAYYTPGWEETQMLNSQVHPSMWQTVEVYESEVDFPINDLVQGENTLWVLAGNEDYSEDTGTAGLDDWQNNPTGVIFVLEIEYIPDIGNPAVDIEKYVGVKTCSNNCCNQYRYQYRYQWNHQCGQQYGYQWGYQWNHQWCNQCGWNCICEFDWYDADEPTGPTIKVGETVYWKYVVENIGDVDLTGVVVWDDNGTDDPGDDFNPAYIGGDVGNDGILGVGEIWIYQASGNAIEGQYTNWGDVTTDQGAYDEDPANYFGEVERGDEGCTPGFWKNNAEKKGAVAWVDYSPDDLFSDVFGVLITIRGNGRSTITDPTLLEALGANGSGINLLARAAVAALLNASHPDVAYALTKSEIIDAVYDAVISGRRYYMTYLGQQLDHFNNGGCPINQNGKRLTFNNCYSYNYNSKPYKPKKR